MRLNADGCVCVEDGRIALRAEGILLAALAGGRGKGMKKEPDYEFVDMHCHIMPEVDDGSESMEMTLAMLRIARENHIGAMIATPHHKGGHHNVPPEETARLIGEVQRAGKAAGIEVPALYPGNEVLYDSSVVDALREGRIQTMGGSDYVLVEFRPWEEYGYLREGLRVLLYEGYRPILAHCERYECLVKDAALAEGLHRNGVSLQVNAGSVIPKLFDPAAGFVRRLLEEEMVDFVGTDAHKDRGRTPEMLPAWRYLVRKYDPEYVREICRENAGRIVGV